MIVQYGSPWFMRRTSLKRIKIKMKLVALGIAEDVKGDEELLRTKYPEANTIIKSADDLFTLAKVVDEGLDGLLAKLSTLKNEGGK